MLRSACPECGVDIRDFPREEVGQMLRDNAAEWQEILDSNPELVRQRPAPSRWSALEYGCHVRDVHRVYVERLGLMLTEDDPHYPNWDQDETAVDDQYHAQNPAIVAVELSDAAAELAALFDTVDGDAWTRTGTRSDGAEFTVETFARYFIHDPIHHLWDVRSGLAELEQRA